MTLSGFPLHLCKPIMFIRRALFPGLVILFYISGAIAEEKPCTVHEDGKFYDLNPLKSKYVRVFSPQPVTG